MKAVVQRVSEASVSSEGEEKGSIEKGLVVLLGIREDDGEEKAEKLVEKIKDLRVFEDEEGKLNLPLKEVDGEVLIISQFTLYGDCSRGNRPSFDKAAGFEKAERLYKDFVEKFENQKGLKVESGSFGDYMKIDMVNDGPVTLVLEY